MAEGNKMKHWDPTLENILQSFNLPTQRRQCNLENALWLQRNLAIRNAHIAGLSMALTLLKCEIWRLKQEVKK